MSHSALIAVTDHDARRTLIGFLSTLLQQPEIDALVVPQQMPGQRSLMPTLVTDPELLAESDPLAPAFFLNAARMVARLTRRPSGRKIAALLRPCEIRALVELVKLKQASTDGLILIGLDCLGAFSNSDYRRFAQQQPAVSSTAFAREALAGATRFVADLELSAACRCCEHPVAAGADIQLGLFGLDIQQQVLVIGQSPTGRQLLERLQLPPAESPPARESMLAERIARAVVCRDAMFERTRAATSSIPALADYLAGCVGCLNCRVACPVCYCKECVFATETFDHESFQYLQWAERKGRLALPSDILFYHLTRMAHMSTACVGCGQCSNACPNEIALLELFRSVAWQTQRAFDYEAGRSLAEKPPLSEFHAEEFGEVVGIA